MWLARLRAVLVIYGAPFGCCHMALAQGGCLIPRTIIALQKEQVPTGQLGKNVKRGLVTNKCLRLFNFSIQH